jgi:HK97 family phage prohead protease
MKRTTYDGVLTKTESPQTFTKADGEVGALEGYASKWWEVDSYGECTAPGCFAKSIVERGPKGADRILFRYEHMVTCGKHTDIEEDQTGLRISAAISDDGQDGTRLRRHLKDGITYGLSIGFRNIRSRPGTPEDPFNLAQAPAWLTQNPEGFRPEYITVLEEVKLLENSAVSFPAVDTAIIDSYRSGTEDMIRLALERLDAALKSGRLTINQAAELRRLAALVPAASGPDPDERSGAPAASPDSTPTARNFAAEARLALLRAGLHV